MEKNSLREKQAIRAKSLRQLLTQKQKDDIKKAFDHFDQRGAGSIKKKELKVILRALGFDPSNDELDKIVYEQNENKEDDTIDFQQFMDIMLTKIKEKISNNDINYGFNKIASIRKKDNPNDYKYIFAADIEAVAETLGEKLTKEEIDEMLNEALQMGKLLNKDDKNLKETKEKDIEKLMEKNKKLDDKFNEVNQENIVIKKKYSTLKENQEQLIMLIKIIQENGVDVDGLIDKWNNEIEAEEKEGGGGGETDNTKSVDIEMLKEHEKYEFLPITVDNSKKSRSIIKGVPKLNFDAIKKTKKSK